MIIAVCNIVDQYPDNRRPVTFIVAPPPVTETKSYVFSTQYPNRAIRIPGVSDINNIDGIAPFIYFVIKSVMNITAYETCDYAKVNSDVIVNSYVSQTYIAANQTIDKYGVASVKKCLNTLPDDIYNHKEMYKLADFLHSALIDFDPHAPISKTFDIELLEYVNGLSLPTYSKVL